MVEKNLDHKSLAKAPLRFLTSEKANMSKNVLIFLLSLDYFINSDKCLRGLGIRSALPHCTSTSEIFMLLLCIIYSCHSHVVPQRVGRNMTAWMGDQIRY